MLSKIVGAVLLLMAGAGIFFYAIVAVGSGKK